MRKNKSKGFLLFLLFLLAILSAALLYFRNNPDRLTGLFAVKDGDSPMDVVYQFLGGEPQEVRRLRKAELVLSDPGHTEYYFHTLSEEEQRCYREMLDGIRRKDEQFYITLSGDEEVNRVYKAVLFDHPELYWVHNRERVYRTVYGDSKYCLFTPGYTYTNEESAAIDSVIEGNCAEVGTLIPVNSTEYETCRIVYTYVIEHTDYAASEHDQNIAGVFWQNQAVCAGYAGAVQYLLERLGIYCIYVEGETEGSDEGHAWNIVRLDGDYYYLDATNGDQPEFLTGDAASLAEHKTIIYDYLCPFPDEYEETYFADPEFEIPDCSEVNYNFYVMNNACFDSYDIQKVTDLCKLRIDNNAAVIRFKFWSENDYLRARDEWISEDAASEIAQYYMQVHGMQRVEYHSGTLENFKTIYFIF